MRWVGRRAGGVVINGSLVLLVAGCSAAAAGPSRSGSAPAGTTTITVAAASSLTEAMDQLVTEFSTSHRGITVRVTTGSSASLAAQLRAGAPIDVLASAGSAVMVGASADGTVRAPVAFASNQLQIAVPSANPGHLKVWSDIGKPATTLARCAVPAPCGTAADQLLGRSGLRANVVSLDPDVKAVINRVRQGR